MDPYDIIAEIFGVGSSREVALPQDMPTDEVLARVKEERQRQIEKWGANSDNHPFEWMSILGEEFGELCEAVNETCFTHGEHPERGGTYRILNEAIHVAAVAVAIAESAIRVRKAELVEKDCATRGEVVPQEKE